MAWQEQASLVSGEDGALSYRYAADAVPLLVGARSAASPLALFQVPNGWFFREGPYRFTLEADRVVSGARLSATFEVNARCRTTWPSWTTRGRSASWPSTSTRRPARDRRRGRARDRGSAGRRYLRAVVALTDRLESQGLARHRCRRRADGRRTRQGRRHPRLGTGHSHMLAEEMFYRAGGLVRVRPILFEGLMMHASAPLEHDPGATARAGSRHPRRPSHGRWRRPRHRLQLGQQRRRHGDGAARAGPWRGYHRHRAWSMPPPIRLASGGLSLHELGGRHHR